MRVSTRVLHTGEMPVPEVKTVHVGSLAWEQNGVPYPEHLRPQATAGKSQSQGGTQTFSGCDLCSSHFKVQN